MSRKQILDKSTKSAINILLIDLKRGKQIATPLISFGF